MTEEWGKAMFYCINFLVTFKAKYGYIFLYAAFLLFSEEVHFSGEII